MWSPIQGVTRPIAGNQAGNESDDEEERSSEQVWAQATEILAASGWLPGSGLEEEMADLEDTPPWQAVSPGDVAALAGAYRRAQTHAQELRAALAGVGLDAEEFPELCGTLDGQGQPVVGLGAVDVRTAARLTRVLGRRPAPPAKRLATGDRDEGRAA